MTSRLLVAAVCVVVLSGLVWIGLDRPESFPSTTRLAEADASSLPARLASYTCKVLVDHNWSGTQWVDTGKGFGTGVVLNEDGWFITAGHVLKSANKVVVICPDGIARDADKFHFADDCDVGVVHVPGWSGTPAAHGGRVSVGDRVVAFGHPKDFLNSYTEGIVSGLHRNLLWNGNRVSPIMDYIQSDAETTKGNSGGGLFLRDSGLLVGINVNSLNASGETAGMTFSIPIGFANRVAQSLINGTRRGYRGDIFVLDLYGAPADMHPHARSLAPHATRIQKVVGRPYWSADLRVGDVVVGIEGEQIQGIEHLLGAMYAPPAKNPLTLVVIRDGVQRDVPVSF